MKRKLTIFSASYPFGPTETFLHNEVLYLSQYFDVEIYPLLKKAQSSTLQSVPENVKYSEPFLPRSYTVRIFLGLFNISPILCFFKDLAGVFRSSNNFRYSLKEWFLYMITYRAVYASKKFKSSLENSDLIYFYWAQFPISWLPNNLNLFVRVHGGEVNFQRHRGYIPMIHHKILSKNVTYLVISQDALTRVRVINKDANCILSRLGVDSRGRNPIPRNSDRLRIVSCSNVIALKRVHLVVEALSLINNIDIEWVHFGDGVLMNKLQDQASRLPDNINVTFKGRVPNSDVMKYYQSTPIDLFINVSETEGVPVSIMEALSFGIPCFATNVGGTSEILNERGGKLVVKDFAIEELVAFIKEIRKTVQSHDLRSGAFLLWENKCFAKKNYEIMRKVFQHS